MPLVQKWTLGIIALGAFYMVVTNSSGFFKVTQGVRQLVAGSVVDVSTGGKGRPNYPTS